MTVNGLCNPLTVCTTKTCALGNLVQFVYYLCFFKGPVRFENLSMGKKQWFLKSQLGFHTGVIYL